MEEKQFNTSSTSNLKRWNGTTHSGQSTASCTLQKNFIAAHLFIQNLSIQKKLQGKSIWENTKDAPETI